MMYFIMHLNLLTYGYDTLDELYFKDNKKKNMQNPIQS